MAMVEAGPPQAATVVVHGVLLGLLRACLHTHVARLYTVRATCSSGSFEEMGDIPSYIGIGRRNRSQLPHHNVNAPLESLHFLNIILF